MKLLVKALALKIALVAMVIFAPNARGQTTNIAVPNGDFSDPSNYGSQSGSLGAIGSYDRRIDYASNLDQGDGVWRGQGIGILGVIAPPTTRITAATQRGEILGIGVNALGIASNSARIYQNDIGVDYIANRLYTLSATVDLGTVLSLDVLNSPGFGIALLSNGNILASSATAPNVSLGLLSGTTYQLTLQHAIYTGNPAVGTDIGISLFQSPSGLLGVGVTQVAFDNITLTATVVPEPSSLLFVALGSGLLLRRQRRLTPKA